ncbi:flavodoxin family protein [Candidatus Bipolaricaulota bacterium]|nr:flavodoxin family protein [Candidatus Bipolaricaulota bacterium]
MSEQLLVLIGSPRKEGNSATLAGEAAEQARQLGSAVDTVFLHDLRITPCDGCGKCRRSIDAECVIEDDMTSLYPKLRGASAILIATPIYSYSSTAQTKLLLDRLYALGSSNGSALSGKRYGFIVVYGGSNPFDSGAATAMRCFHDTFARKASWMRMVHGSVSALGDAAKNVDLLVQARELGQDLISERE